MPNKLIFKDAEKARDAIMDSQKKEIAALYNNWADEIGERAKYYSHKSTASAPVSERYYKELQKQLRATSQDISNEVYNKIKKNMYTVADAVVEDNIKWLESFGFAKDGLNAAFSYVPDEIVRNLITGQIYDSGWSLSARIWSDNEATLKSVYQVMAGGLAQNKSIYEIAKDLENYVRPGAKKNWNPLIAMKNTKTGEIEYKRIYKNQVDYNAQRLARTLVQHGYQQSFVATTQNNPFITEYIWISNGSRVCELCAARDGVHFKKNELPLDHPNGMCTMEPAVAEDMIDQLADWFNSPDGTYPEIDAFAGNFGYNASKGGTIQDFVNKYGTSTKNPSAWYHSMSPIQKAEAKLLKDAEGLSWNDFYEKYVYSGSTDDLVAWKTKVAAKSKTKTETIKVFSKTQDEFLSPYGFSPENMPKNFDDWSYKVSHSQASDILKSMGTDWGDPHPYQKLMKFYNENLTDSNLVDKIVDVSKATTKVTTKAATKVDDVFDATKWYDTLKKNDLDEFNNLTKDWLKVISASEKSAVETYTGSAYWDMNSYLRGQKSSTSYKTAIKNCQAALSKAKLPRETIVRRGADYNMLDELKIGPITPQNKSNVIGAILEDKGFMSTSPAPQGGFTYRDIEYVIKLPEGSQAMYVDSISKHKGEQELLINCGGKYMVEDVEFDSWGNVNKIYMTLKNLKN